MLLLLLVLILLNNIVNVIRILIIHNIYPIHCDYEIITISLSIRITIS